MPSMWSAFTARVGNRLARHFCAAPHSAAAGGGVAILIRNEKSQPASGTFANLE
jgi:hypothetical protein